jgi:hypothetical protein
MLYHNYKDAEQNLKERFRDKVVRVEPIEPADVYYTDGDASISICKLIFTGGNTVYIPQLIYNVNQEDKKIISEWMKYVNDSM